jgi:hypothetical protein
VRERLCTRLRRSCDEEEEAEEWDEDEETRCASGGEDDTSTSSTEATVSSVSNGFEGCCCGIGRLGDRNCSSSLGPFPSTPRGATLADGTVAITRRR